MAGVGDGDDVAVGLFVEEEADLGGLALGVVDEDAEAVDVVVVDVGGGKGDLVAHEGDGGGGGERGGALGVDELGVERKMKRKETPTTRSSRGARGGVAPLGFAAFGRGLRWGR